MAEQQQVERVALPDEWHGAARRIGWALFAAWFALGAAALFFGESRATYAELERDVASGAVTEVQVTRGLGREARGFAVVEVHWHKGWFGHTTQVVEANPIDRGGRQVGGSDVTARVSPTTTDRLREIEPGLDVSRTSRGRFGGEVFGRSAPDWVVFATFLVWLSTITYLIAAPRPWRATKWAWFWLLGILPPLGPLAFLAIGGPTRVLGPPAPGSRRLTGGWAFLIALVLGSVVLTGSR